MTETTKTDNNNDIKFLLESFIRGFEETKRINQNLQIELQSLAIDITEIKSELQAMKTNHDWLIKTIRDEGGDKSFMSRVLIMENNMKAYEYFMNEQKRKEENKSKALDSLTSEEHKGKWQLRIALATGCLGFIATVVTAILNFVLKK